MFGNALTWPAANNVSRSSVNGVHAPAAVISGSPFQSNPMHGTEIFGHPIMAFGIPSFPRNGGFSRICGGFSTTTQTCTVPTVIGARYQCITVMKEYDNKSLEELRLEDYAVNRKGGSVTTGFGFRSSTPLNATPTSGFTFLQTGTATKFIAPFAIEIANMKGLSTNIHTGHQYITCMQEYENNSFEELRMKDYDVNSKVDNVVTGLGPGTATIPFRAPIENATYASSFGNTTRYNSSNSTGMSDYTFRSIRGFSQTQQNQNMAGMFGLSVRFDTPSASELLTLSFGGNNSMPAFQQNNQQRAKEILIAAASRQTRSEQGSKQHMSMIKINVKEFDSQMEIAFGTMSTGL